MNMRVSDSEIESTRHRKILHRIFMAVLCCASIVALATSGLILLTDTGQDSGLVSAFFWLNWVFLVAGVVGGLYALKTDFLELSSREALSDLRNSLAEVIDGLEASGRLSHSEAALLRNVYGGRLGVSGTIYLSDTPLALGEPSPDSNSRVDERSKAPA